MARVARQLYFLDEPVHGLAKRGAESFRKADIGGVTRRSPPKPRARLYGWNSGNEDTVWCFDAATGEVVWKYAYKCDLEANSHAGGPGSTPTVDGDCVYTMSKRAQIHCLEIATGKVKWSKNAVTDFGATNRSKAVVGGWFSAITPINSRERPVL